MREQDPEQDRIERQAVAWHVKLGRPRLAARDHAAFQRWLARDPRHRRSYDRMAALWRRLDQPARLLGAGGWYREAAPRSWLRLTTPLGVLAAALLLAVMMWRDPGLAQRLRADQATPPGAQRDLVLADGSRVTLDADSAIDVELSTGRREVRLRRGRAWFEVQSDPTSPFRVTAGGVDVEVIGTGFAVERPEATGGPFAVLVEHGSVTVSGGDLARPVRLSAGQGLEIGAGRDGAVHPINPDTRIAWRRGLVVFDRATMALVAAELTRITGRRIVVLDAALENATLSGVFRRNDPEAILAALSRTMNVRVTTMPGLVTLIRY